MLRGGALWPILSLLALFGLAFTGLCSAAGTRDHVAALDFVRNLPHATLAAPRSGPALYTGTMSGPDGRLDFGGNRAAARWWWVVERISKDTSKTVCFEHQIDKLRFFDNAGGSAALPMFDEPKGLSLLAVSRDEAWKEALQIDLGTQAPYKPAEWPQEANRCTGKRRTFITRTIPEGAPVDVLACFEGGSFVACASKPAAIIAVGGIQNYLSRRETRASLPFLVVALLFGVAFAVLTFFALQFKNRLLRPVVPETAR